MRTRRLAYRLSAVVLGVLLPLGVVELLVRAARPELPYTESAHDVLFLAPDRHVGWKHPQDFSFYWNGRNPYCIEFRVPVTTNSFGFRDRPRAIEKPPDTTRIAVLGDSFIEAIQVPLEQTVTSQLEARLKSRFPDAAIEVMNFGVSNYGVGQYLLLYQSYVRTFKPDFVVVFASYLNFSRTMQRELSSRLQAFYALNVRPSFELDNAGALRHVPARDYERYSQHVEVLLAEQFGPDRTIEIPPIRTPLALPHWALNVVSRKARPSASPQGAGTDFPHVDVNYRILEDLHREVSSDGAVLVMADAFEYLERYGVVRGSGALTARNRIFVTSLGASHVDLSPSLRAAPHNPQFECDMHFNAEGHRVVAGTLADWFTPVIRRPALPRRAEVSSRIMVSSR